MRVLHIVASIDKSAGGPSRSVPQTCKHLSELGVNIHLVSNKSDNPVEIEETEKFKVSFKSIIGLLRFGISLKKDDYDIIHLQYIWVPYAHIMAFFARLKGISYIITPRGMLEPWIMNHNALKKKVAMFLYQRKDIKKASLLHVTCEAEKASVRNLGFDNPISIIPNGIDLTNVPIFKEKYGSKKLVFMSRIHLKKGIELLLDAWKNIDNKGWVLEIAGEGDAEYEKKLKSKVQEENITNISFVGSVYGENKWNFLKSADVFILPTYSENFGIVVAEALAVGVPVITTKGAPWEELETNNCGWWIDLSVDNLKETINKVLYLDNKEIERMGINGIELVKKEYDIKSVAQHILDVYKNIKSSK